MKFSSCLALALIVSVVSAQVMMMTGPPPPPPGTPLIIATTTVSGDPHVYSWDGTGHDTMTQGWFTYAQNSIVNVQAFAALGCNGAVPTCIKMQNAEIKLTSGERLFFSFGYWPFATPGYPSGYFPLVVAEFVPAIAADAKGVAVPQWNKTTTYTATSQYVDFNTKKLFAGYNRPIFATPRLPGGKYLLKYTGSAVSLTPTAACKNDVECSISISMGAYSLSMGLPKYAPHLGSTNGLLGYFDGTPNDDYRTRNFTSSKQATAVNARYNNQKMVDWAKTHAVGGATNPMLSVHGPDHPHYSIMDVDPTTPSLVNDFNASKLVANFLDLQMAQDAQKHCTNIISSNEALKATGAHDIFFQNCMMDAAANDDTTPDVDLFAIASSNGNAVIAAQDLVEQQNATDAPLLSGALLVAVIVMSSVAGVAILAAIALTIHNRRLKEQVDNYALVVYQGNTGATEMPVSNVGAIQV